jgi:hypothetical protein
MKTRPAPYNTKCRGCGRAIAKGDTCHFAKHEGARCRSCGPADAPALPKPAPEPPKSEPPPEKPAPRRSKKSPAPKPAPKPLPALPAPLTCPPAALGTDGFHRWQWDSVADLVADAFGHAAAQSATNVVKIAQSIRQESGGRWANHQTAESLQRLVHAPDRRLLAAIEEMRDKLADEITLPTAPRRRVRHGRADGDELDADRWLHRIPEAWDRCERVPQPRGTLEIFINLSVHCKQAPDELLYRGAAACALADLLAKQGRNVGISGFLVSCNMSKDSRRIITKVRLKDPAMPLDMAAVATAACEIGFFRMAMIHAAVRHVPGELNDGFGHPANLPEEDTGAADFVIGGDVRSKAVAVAWLKGAAGRFTGDGG